MHIKFIKLAKKPSNYRIYSPCLFIIIVSIFNFKVFGQPSILPNGQATLSGLDAGLFIDSPARTKIDLAGTWKFSLDEEQWKDVVVPGSVDYEGRMVFRRSLNIDQNLLDSSVIKLVAFGINYECEIYLNDVFVGKHSGGYTSFELEVPEEALQSGEELFLKIIVDNRLSARGTIPPRKQVWGWKNYGGIVRDIYLLATPRLWIDKMHVRKRIDSRMNQASLLLECVLANKQYAGFKLDTLALKAKNRSYHLNSELYERFSDVLVAQGMSAPLTLESNKNTSVELALTVNESKFWSPENPELYILKTSIVVLEGKQRTTIDEYNANVGFSSVRVDQTSIFLNGNRVMLKGVVWHEDSPKYGASLTYEQMEKDVVLIKSLGANAIRFAFHPPHPYMINLCSRYGLLAFEEAPIWNVPSEILLDETFQVTAETQIREMIERDCLYPCILAWGFGDQFDSADERTLAVIQRIVTVMRRIDERPIYYGTTLLKNDVCASAVDFVGISVFSTEIKNFRRLLSDWKKAHPTQPTVILSYGKEVEQNNRNGYSDPMSQESQARYYLQHFAAIKESNATGSFVAALADWRGDRPLLNFGLSEHFVHPVGLLTITREKRLAYDVVRALYHDERISTIPAGHYKATFPWVHVLVGLLVILLIGYQTTNRRFNENLKRSLIRSYNFFVDLRDLHKVSISHTLILSSAISMTLAGLLSSIMVHFRGDRIADYLVTMLLVQDILKVKYIYATWNPLAGVIILTGFFFILGFVLAIFIKIAAWFVRTKVSWFHVYSVSVWGAAPIVFLSPLAMSLFKIMENPIFIIPSLILMSLFFFWTCLRVLKGISVIYNFSPLRTYIGGAFICLLLLGGAYFYYDSVYALSSYIKFVLHIAFNS